MPIKIVRDFENCGNNSYAHPYSLSIFKKSSGCFNDLFVKIRWRELKGEKDVTFFISISKYARINKIENIATRMFNGTNLDTSIAITSGYAKVTCENVSNLEESISRILMLNKILIKCDFRS